MATSLNALSMVVGMDTSQVNAGVGSMRQQLGRANRIMQMAKTPADKLAEGTRALAVAQQKGAITAEQQAKGLRALYARYGQTSAAAGQTNMQLMSQLPIVGNLTGRLGMMGGRVSGSAAALGGLGTAAIVVAAPLAAMVATIAAGVVAFKGLSAATRMMIDEMSRLDPTIKSAGAMGALVGDVQALQYAFGQLAGMSGGETEQALSRLQRRIGEAAQGAGAAKGAINRLGLSAKQLATLTPTEQMNAVAEAMKGVTNGAQQAALAKGLFGDAGKKLLPVLRAQSDELTKAQQRAHQFGLTLTQVQATGIEAANDSLDDLTKIVQGFKTQISAEFAPVFTTIASILRDDILPHAGGMQVGFRMAADTAVVMLGTVLDMGNAIAGTARLLHGDFRAGFEQLKSGVKGEATAKLTSGLADARLEAFKVSQAVADVGGGITEGAEAAEALAKSYKQQAGQLHLQIVSMREGEAVARRLKLQQEGFTTGQIMKLENQHRMLDSLKAEADRREKMKKAAGDYFKAERQRVDELRRLGDQVRDSVRNPFEVATDEIAKLMALLNQGVIDRSTFDKARRDAVEGLSEMGSSEAPAAISAGSQEAYKYAVNQMTGKRNKQLQKMNEQVILQKAMLDTLHSVDRHIRDIPQIGLFR